MVNNHAHEGVETISNPSESARQTPTQVLNSPSQGKPQCSPHYDDNDDRGHETFQGSPIFHLGGKSLGFGIAGRWLLEWLALNFNLIHKLLHCLGTIPDHALPPIACISSCISTYCVFGEQYISPVACISTCVFQHVFHRVVGEQYISHPIA